MQVVRHINSGGFGKVEEVVDLAGARWARKTYSPAPGIVRPEEEPKLAARFKREAKIQAQLDPHLFIPIVLAVLDSEPPHYFMPLADTNLDEAIKTARMTGIFPVHALADILNSLEKLHSLGYVHRDLKPQNVLLHNGAWKLSDFGLVLPPVGTTTKLTSVDSAWGTEAYCAPEQTTEFGHVTAAADIYAFGCILHDFFVGLPRVPYARHSAPGVIGTIIEKCTESKAIDRFRTVGALRAALLPFLAAPTFVAQPLPEWTSAVAALLTWDSQRFREFVRYLENDARAGALTPLLMAMGEGDIQFLHQLDPDIWKRFATAYCRWVEDSGFDFGVCDIIVVRLEQFFILGDSEIKSRAALASAELGRSHNRWFVMGKVLSMCGSGLDEALAHRIAIEIMAADARYNFLTCATRIGRSISEYHPRIAKILE